ncbi:hypothetical protein V6N13_083247 [Hibiscus sabdariffa]
MVSQTQQELQRVQSDVQRFQTDLQQVKTTVADRFSQEERTIEGTLSSARVEIQDELSVFKNDVQSQISSLESMIRNFFEQPRVPTGVTTKSLASSTIMGFSWIFFHEGIGQVIISYFSSRMSYPIFDVTGYYENGDYHFVLLVYIVDCIMESC